MKCPKCKYKNEENSNFCSDCGYNFVSKNKQDERRQITVIFCDVVNSTELSRSLDPEEYQQTIYKYQTICNNVVDNYDGYVAQYLGDGVLIYFGFPNSHEDDSARAIHTALQIISQLGQTGINVRIGLHSGEVLLTQVGVDYKSESLAIGEVPNIAANILKLANKNEIIISSQLYHLVQGKFVCELVNSSSPDRIYKVIDAVDTPSRFAVNVARGLTPYIERENYLEILENELRVIDSSKKKVVMIEGEAGLGKSRLVYELRNTDNYKDTSWITCQCWETNSNSPYDSVIHCLKKDIGIDEKSNNHKNIKSIENFLLALDLPTNKNVQILAELLSLQSSEDFPRLNITPERLRLEFIKLVSDILERSTKNTKTVFLVEDLHWIDPSTLELFQDMLSNEKLKNILFLFTFRPDFNSEWSDDQDKIHLRIKPFEQYQVENMISTLNNDLPEDVRSQIIDRSDGVPLFIEEITKVVDDLKDGKSITSYAPKTLSEYLLARMDKLGEAKIVAQMGSIIGREFNQDDILLFTGHSQGEVASTIASLVNEGVCVETSDNKFIFKHALLQNAAYNSLPRKSRAQYHRKYADFLEEKLADTPSEVNLELLAYNFEGANDYEKSVDYWQKAAENAMLRSANLEAVNNIQHGLNLIKNIKESPNMLNKLLSLDCMLGLSMVMLKGWASEDVNKAYMRAQEVANKIDSKETPISLLCGLAMYYMVSYDHVKAIDLGMQLYNYTEPDNKDYIDTRLAGCFVVGYSYLMLGNTDESQQFIMEGVGLDYNIARDFNPKYFSIDMSIMSLAYHALLSHVLGYQDRALSSIVQGVEKARILNHPHTIAFTLYKKALVHCMRREAEEAQKAAEECIKLSDEQCFPHCKAAALMLLGWALADKGHYEDGIKFTNEGANIWRMTGAKTGLTCFLSFLVDEYLMAGQIDIGLDTVNDLIEEMSQENSEKLYLHELLRLKGELLLAKCDENTAIAEECFQGSIKNSQSDGQKSLEFRGVMSLGKLYKKQGRGSEAKEKLSEILEWFEQNNTNELRDIIEAREILAQL